MAARLPLTQASSKPYNAGERPAPAGVGAYAKGAAKRDEILAGLMDKVARQELRNPSLREIGRALGVQPAHILYYFGSREELLQAVIMRWDESASNRESGDTTLDRFAAQIERNVAIPGIVHLYLAFAAEAVDPAHPAHDYFHQRFLRVRASLAERIRKEQAQGTIAPDLDPDTEARHLIALADGLQLQSLVDTGVNAASDLAAAIRSLRSRNKS